MYPLSYLQLSFLFSIFKSNLKRGTSNKINSIIWITEAQKSSFFPVPFLTGVWILFLSKYSCPWSSNHCTWQIVTWSTVLRDAVKVIPACKWFSLKRLKTAWILYNPGYFLNFSSSKTSAVFCKLVGQCQIWRMCRALDL